MTVDCRHRLRELRLLKNALDFSQDVRRDRVPFRGFARIPPCGDYFNLLVRSTRQNIQRPYLGVIFALCGLHTGNCAINNAPLCARRMPDDSLDAGFSQPVMAHLLVRVMRPDVFFFNGIWQKHF